MIADYLKNAVGPAPWYWKRFPKIQGKTGGYHWIFGNWERCSKLRWKEGMFHWIDGEYDGKIYLISDREPHEIRFAVCMYTTVFPVTSRLFGIWYRKNSRLVVSIYDPDTLEYDPTKNQGGPERKTNDCYDQHLATISLSSDLEEGIYDILLPSLFKKVGEILLISTSWDTSKREYPYAIYVLNTQDNRVKVVPQKWYTAPPYDAGYDWITTIVRDPKSR